MTNRHKRTISEVSMGLNERLKNTSEVLSNRAMSPKDTKKFKQTKSLFKTFNNSHSCTKIGTSNTIKTGGLKTRNHLSKSALELPAAFQTDINQREKIISPKKETGR